MGIYIKGGAKVRHSKPCCRKMCRSVASEHADCWAASSTDVLPTRRFADRRYADNVGRFADTYNCIKTAFHDISARMSVS